MSDEESDVPTGVVSPGFHDCSLQAYIDRIVKQCPEDVTDWLKVVKILVDETNLEAEDTVTDSAISFHIPQIVYKKLYTHQRVGVRFLWALYHNKMGGLIADEMGLGKTFQVTALFTALMASGDFNKHGDTRFIPDVFANHADMITTRETVEELLTELWKETQHACLVVCPATLIPQWAQEATSLYPLLRVYQLRHIDRHTAAHVERGGLFITSYEFLRTHLRFFKNIKWFYGVLDEGQKIRNPDAQITLAVKNLIFEHRVLLSGTPVQNEMKEFWSIFDFVEPGRLGTLPVFTDHFSVPIERASRYPKNPNLANEGKQRIAAIKAILNPHLLRRTKHELQTDAPLKTVISRPDEEVPVADEAEGFDLGWDEYKTDFNLKEVKTVKSEFPQQESEYPQESPEEGEEVEPSKRRREVKLESDDLRNVARFELPNKNEQVLFCYLSASQYKTYVAFLKSQKVDRLMSDYALEERKMSRRALLPLLRKIQTKALWFVSNLTKICNHPDLLWTEEEKPDFGNKRRSMKLMILLDIIKAWKKKGTKGLVFSQSLQMLDIIEIAVRANEYKYLRMDGKTPVSSRLKMVNEFNEIGATYTLMLLTTRVGGYGLNITGATEVVIFDPCWNPSVDAQAQDRVARIGQQSDVTVYRLITKGTVEEKIYQRQLRKTWLSEGLLTEEGVHKALKTNEFVGFFNIPPLPPEEGEEISSDEDDAGPIRKKSKTEEANWKTSLLANSNPNVKDKIDLSIFSASTRHALAAIESSESALKSLKEQAATWTGRSGGTAPSLSIPWSLTELAKLCEAGHWRWPSKWRLNSLLGTEKSLVLNLMAFFVSRPDFTASTSDILIALGPLVTSDRAKIFFKESLKLISEKQATPMGAQWTLIPELQRILGNQKAYSFK